MIGRVDDHGGLPSAEPGQLGRAGAGACRLARLRACSGSATTRTSCPRWCASTGRCLGEITGLRGLHLQCHIGTDTLSLHRLGARMSGLDFSGPALAEARALAASVGADIDYVQADAYAAVERFGAGGSTCSTPASARCAGCPTSPAGAGWSPTCWRPVAGCSSARATRCCGRSTTGAPTTCWSSTTRTSRPSSRWCGTRRAPTSPTEVEFAHNRTASWNHGIGEIITAVLDAGLRLTQFVEHRSVPWEALPGAMTRGEDEEWRLTERPERLPLTYTLQAVKD